MASIILTGGKSGRMGQDKATLLFRNRPLLDTVAETAAKVAAPVYVIADTKVRYHSPGTLLRSDALPEAGPAGGVFTGLLEAGEGDHLVLACDLPYLDPDVLAFLLTSLTPPALALVPEIGGRLEPLCAVYSHRILEPLKKALRDGERSLQTILRSLDIQVLDEMQLRRRDPDLKNFTNWNYPEEVRNAG